MRKFRFLRDRIAHIARYCVDAEYRREEQIKNSFEWRECHARTLEGIERERGITRIGFHEPLTVGYYR